MRPPKTFFEPGNVPRSTSRTWTPSRARVRAAALPAGPAPTTATSNPSSDNSLSLIPSRFQYFLNQIHSPFDLPLHCHRIIADWRLAVQVSSVHVKVQEFLARLKDRHQGRRVHLVKVIAPAMIEPVVSHEGYLLIADRIIVDILPEVPVDFILLCR